MSNKINFNICLTIICLVFVNLFYLYMNAIIIARLEIQPVGLVKINYFILMVLDIISVYLLMKNIVIKYDEKLFILSNILVLLLHVIYLLFCTLTFICPYVIFIEK